jgi:hypothetical protein
MIKLPLVFQIQGRELHIFRDVPLLLSAFTDSLIWQEANSGYTFHMTVLGMISTLVIFFAVLVVFVPLGQLLGRLLDDHRNTVVAYSINVAASLVGIWCFGAFSLIYSPPWVWFAVIVLLLLTLSVFDSDRSRLNYISILALAATVVFMALFPSDGRDSIRTVWSPLHGIPRSGL